MKSARYIPESLNLRSVLDLLLHIEMQYDREKNHLVDLNIQENISQEA